MLHVVEMKQLFYFYKKPQSCYLIYKFSGIDVLPLLFLSKYWGAVFSVTMVLLVVAFITE